MRELDRQVLKVLNTFLCPKCGATLSPIKVDGVVVGFDCLDCEEFYSYDNIACS